MTALNFELSENNLTLFMDTLVSINDVIKRPLMYTTKMYMLPHLNCIICGVGSGEIKFKWYEYVMQKVIAYGISSLNNITQLHLHNVVSSCLTNAPCEIYQIMAIAKVANPRKYAGFINNKIV